jgi:DNA polymerase III subunit epsilon
VGTVKFWRGVSRWRDRLLPRRARTRAAARRPAVFLAGLVSGDRALAETDFVVVDLETTGWTPAEARITEIGAVRVTGGQITGEFSALINPGQPIPPDIAELTGISDDMVARAPAIGTVLPGFLAFAGSGVLTAHNAPFDLGFLIAACADCGLSWPGFSVLDTVTLARQVLGEAEVPDCKLATLASYFGAPTSPCHRALADARATVTVLHGLIARLAESGVRTLAELAG